MKNRGFLFIIPRLKERNEYGTYISDANNILYYGVALMSSYLRANGFKTDIIDCQKENLNDLALKNEIKKKDFDYVGITAIYGNMDKAYSLAKTCKEVFSDKKVIIGGLPATFAFKEIFRESPFIDICIIGEGEETVLELMMGKNFNEIDGIAYREGSKLFINKERLHVKNLDKHPFPNYELFDKSFYKEKYTPYETSRGCPFSCSFCCQGKKEGRMLREKSIKRVIDDFKKIAGMGFCKIMIIDNDFLTNTERAKTILKEVAREEINKKVHFFIATRISNILKEKEELMTLMKAANVKVIFIGIESLCEVNQKKLGKIKSIEAVKELFDDFYSLKINIIPSYIFGFPNEKKEDMEKTYQSALYLGTKMFKFNIFTPYPGTDLYNEMEASKLINHGIPLHKYDNSHKVYYNPLDLEGLYHEFVNNYLYQQRDKELL